MNPTLTEKLYTDFPYLYRGRTRPREESSMCWGFECDDGWYQVLHDLSRELMAYHDQNPDVEFEVTQVKWKLGSLRFRVMEVDAASGSLVWLKNIEIRVIIDRACQRLSATGELMPNAREGRRLRSPHADYSSLTEEEKAWLGTLNDCLRQVEEKYSLILRTKRSKLQARVADPSDWLAGFNLKCVITFYLREDDEGFEKDDDNILTEIHEWYVERDEDDPDWGFGATHIDHAEKRDCFLGESHCYLYRQLYDHTRLGWRDLLRIGSMYVEIKIDEQSGMLPVSRFSSLELRRRAEWQQSWDAV